MSEDTLPSCTAAEMDIHPDTALALVNAAKPLWDAMADLGMVDAWNGAECRRVLPQTIAFVHRQANLIPTDKVVVRELAAKMVRDDEVPSEALAALVREHGSHDAKEALPRRYQQADRPGSVVAVMARAGQELAVQWGHHPWSDSWATLVAETLLKAVEGE